jgi:hypothetical protein
LSWKALSKGLAYPVHHFFERSRWQSRPVPELKEDSWQYSAFFCLTFSIFEEAEIVAGKLLKAAIIFVLAYRFTAR